MFCDSETIILLTWKVHHVNVAENDLKNSHLDYFDAMDCKKWRKLIWGRQDTGDETGVSGRCVFWLIRCQLTWVVSPELSHLGFLTWIVSPGLSHLAWLTWIVLPGLSHLDCLACVVLEIEPLNEFVVVVAVNAIGLDVALDQML